MLYKELNRRGFLKMGLITGAAGIIPARSFAALGEMVNSKRTLSIYNLHTEEHLDVIYWKDGKYRKDAIDKLNHIFRDHYNGAVTRMDVTLFDVLHLIQQKYHCDEPFHLISGYRSPQTNAQLRKRKKGVAKRSLHIYGKAADIRMPTHSLKDLRRVAYKLKAGGVGYYPRSNFVHVDVGKVRYW